MADQSIQQRLAAVLAADVVGYTRLMEEDSEGTVAAWQSVRDGVINPAVSDHSGRIVKLTGDGFLAEFPTVHEAVRCGIVLQEGFADGPLEFRIGIDLGDIIDDGQDIHGEGVNVAARIEALADPGGISISGEAYAMVRNRVDANYEDRGEHDVKNVSAPVRIYAIRPDDSLVSAAPYVARAITDKPSIAVLPFDNLSNDPDQEYFSDGITEDIITGLSRIRWFLVIARNSSFAYKGKSPDIRDVARELGVRYVVEGSLRKAGNRIRLTAQLIDGNDGTHLWAEKYDRDIENIFDLQDELTQTIIGAIEPELGKAEQERARLKKPDRLEVWDVYQRGMYQLHQLSADSLSAAETTFAAAVKNDSKFAAAFAGLAETYYYRLVLGFTDEPDLLRKEALAAGRRAVELDREDANARCALARAFVANRMFNDAIPEFQATLDINPSQALAHYGLGAAHVFMGSPNESIRHLDNAIRLSPHDANLGSFYVRKAQAHLYLQEHDKAVEWARRSMRVPNFQWSRYVMLISSLGHLGQIDEARSVLDELLKHIPDFSAEYALDYSPWMDDDYFAHLMEGMHKAGFGTIDR